MPSLISRAAPEWFLALGGLLIGTTLLIYGDVRLGIYVLWLHGVNMEMVRWGWTAALWFASLSQILALVICHRRQPRLQGACTLCPSQEKCGTSRWRRRTAGLCAVVWCCLALACAEGGLRSLGAPLAGWIAIGEFLIFALLSPKVARWTRY